MTLVVRVHEPQASLALSSSDAIDVWLLRFDSPWRPVAELRSLLSGHELARADRFAMDKPRRQFIVGRGSLRLLLKRYLGEEPHLRERHQGKPFLTNGAFHFNVSHSGDLGVITVANRPVGVDVEKLRAMPNAAGLVERFFSREERIQFQSLPDDLKLPGFFHGWTGKEALLKAVGVGLADLEGCAVDLDPQAPARVVRFDHPGEWQLKTWNVEGYVVSVAVETVLPPLPHREGGE
jgi:4'-phosphopantetheinyl transferase